MKKNNVTVIQAFKEFIWPRKGIVLVGLILIVVSRLASLVLPLKSKELLDEIIPNQDMGGLINMVLIVAGAILVQAVTSFALTRLLSVEAQLLISKLRAKVQKKVLSFPISYFDNNKSGALVSRIMSDVEGVRNLVGTGLVQLFGGIVTAIVDVMILGYSSESYGPINIIFSVITTLPALAVGARRLHDINKSGWWQLITLTVIGIILLIIWWATIGESKKNPHGNPIKLKK